MYEYLCLLEYHINSNAKLDERTRAVTYSLYVWNTADKKKISIEKFWPLPTDKKQIAKPIDKDKMLELQKRALAKINK